MNEQINNVTLSLTDLLGAEYIKSVCDAQAFLTGKDSSFYQQIADEKIDFYPDCYRKRVDELVPSIGKKVVDAGFPTAAGAGTKSFNDATNCAKSPLAGMGFIRVGEDGNAYLASKSEHYHASFGHHFPGFRLIENAKKIGICNITHNNTRGYITRFLEEEIVRTANGIAKNDKEKLQEILSSDDPNVLNKVINLETGSLAVEASLKMMLACFYRLDDSYPLPLYSGKTPVFLVLADNDGGKKANYHGTTIFTQMMRDMWPDLYNRLDKNNTFIVKSVKINDLDHFKELVDEYDKGDYKIAGFFHEIVLMNYGGVRLTEEFVDGTHTICHERDIPITIDEIQSCMWSHELFIFREYNCSPDFVSLGKGFPGGQYPASKILTNSKMDNLNQFGALVTNGQEELASLAYLIAISFAEANKCYTKEFGEHYEKELSKLAAKHSEIIQKVEGKAHLSTLFFFSAEKTNKFVEQLNNDGIDISAQTYKAECPPVALMKIPLISTEVMLDFLLEKMDNALQRIES